MGVHSSGGPGRESPFAGFVEQCGGRSPEESVAEMETYNVLHVQLFQSHHLHRVAGWRLLTIPPTA